MELDGLPSTVCLRLLWPSPFTFELICMSRSRYIRDLILVKLAQIFTKTLYSHGYSGYCLLWPLPLTHWTRKLISTSTNSSTSVTKIGWNSLNWFFWDMVFTRFSGRTDSETHTLTDGQTRIQNASGTVSGGVIIQQNLIRYNIRPRGK